MKTFSERQTGPHDEMKKRGARLVNKAEMLDIETEYDIENIRQVAAKRLKKSVAFLSLYFLLFIAAAIVFVLYNASSLWAFILTVMAAGISLALCLREIAVISSVSYGDICGEAVDVFKETISKDVIIGGIGLTRRRHDNYKTECPRVTVFVQEKDKIAIYRLAPLNEKHAEYYDEKGELLHISGTRYPVKRIIGKAEWLCPICGEFNSNNEKTCSKCKNKVLK